MQGNELHAKVRDKRRQIIEEIEFLLRQLKACDDTLATLPPVPEPSAHDANPPPPAEPPPAPAPVAPVVTPPPAAVPPAPTPPPAPAAPVETEADDRFKQHQRGWLMARVEQAVADCGDTFTLKQVRAAYEARFGAARRMRASSIAAALWKLSRKHGYKIVRRGTGRAHSVYQR